MVCKIFFCSKFSNDLEKSRRGKATANCNAEQANGFSAPSILFERVLGRWATILILTTHIAMNNLGK